MALTKVVSGVRTIASSEIGTASIADDAVATAKIADDAVTLAKMAPATDGNLITFGSDTQPAYVATGSSGQLLKSQGAGSVPVFATIGLPTANFISSEQTLAYDTTLDVGHSIGAIPSLVEVSLRCKTADLGYSVNDELIFATQQASSANDYGVAITKNATNVTIVTSSLIAIVSKTNKNSEGLTVGSWRWIVKAWT